MTDGERRDLERLMTDLRHAVGERRVVLLEELYRLLDLGDVLGVQPRGEFDVCAAAWPAIVAPHVEATEPWPEAVMRADLAWMAAQVASGVALVLAGRRFDRMPGRPSLAKRWRVTERKAGALLAGRRPR